MKAAIGQTVEGKGPAARGDTLPPLASAPLSPGEHLSILVEMMRPTGPELARRWLAALTLVPGEQREAVVAAVERQIVAEFVDSEQEPA